jgi:hypothetical protein
MGQAYSARQSTLHDGNIITAALFNNEYNAILNAFSYASSGLTGHQHDGTAGEGGNIHTIGDQDFLNKIVIESDEIKFFIEVGGAAVEQLNLIDGVLAPETTNDIDLGTSSKRFKTIYATTLDVSTTLTNSQLANSTVSYGGVSLALGASDATPAFDLSDATNYPTSSLSGTITNAQLAGSIANEKLSNSSVSFGGVSVALGASDATPAFDLTDATNYPTSSLSGTITNSQLAGSIANAKLANSTVSYGGVSLALGASDATPAFDLTDATNYPTSSLSGTITNAQLAGSIANAKLSNSSVSFGGVSVALGASDATPAFDLSDATNYPTSSLSGTITNAQLAGSIANAKLANSSVSFGGVSVALGASDTTPAFDLTDATNYPTSSLSGTITNAQLAGSIAGSKLSVPVEISDAKTSEEDATITITNTNTSTTQDGRIIAFKTGSNHRGSVGVTEVSYGSGSFFAGPGCGLLATTQFTSHIVQPCDSIGDYKDNSVDLGSTNVRFDDVYATNGTIQTSDRNEKQDIAELSDAERRVAVAAKGLLRKFKWQSAVTEKGDNARTHFGIIAQDLQAAFTAEGLDAGDYAMFISTTWWEHEGKVYTQDAPEGATEKTRLGVRYPELLAFIIAAL